MLIIINPTHEQTSTQAAKIVANQIRKKPGSVLGLSTGKTPLGLYRELIRLHRAEGLDFSGVTTFAWMNMLESRTIIHTVFTSRSIRIFWII